MAIISQTAFVMVSLFCCLPATGQNIYWRPLKNETTDKDFPAGTKNLALHSLSIDYSLTKPNFYFLLPSASTWNAAGDHCKELSLESCHLVYFETEAELEDVTERLRYFNKADAAYWTGGKYNPSRSRFEWDNGVAFGSWAPWAEGGPNETLPLTRVSLTTSLKGLYRTDLETESLPYVCECKSELDNSSSGWFIYANNYICLLLLAIPRFVKIL